MEESLLKLLWKTAFTGNFVKNCEILMNINHNGNMKIQDYFKANLFQYLWFVINHEKCKMKESQGKHGIQAFKIKIYTLKK